MKEQRPLTRSAVTERRFNPLHGMDSASRRYALRVLGWTWGLIFSLSFLSVYLFANAWPAQLLVIAGIISTIAVFRRAARKTRRLEPLPHLSGASKCVWLMDREG